MILSKDLVFNAEMYVELLMLMNEYMHVDSDDLNAFKENEQLDTLSSELLKKRLEKSLGIDLGKVSKMLKKSDLPQETLVRVAHYGIQIGESSESTIEPVKKRKKVEQPSVSLSNVISLITCPQVLFILHYNRISNILSTSFGLRI